METNKFSVVMSEKVDMELVRIVTSERADYQPEAVIAAEEELKRRNITPSMYQDYTKEVEKLIEVEKEKEVEKQRLPLSAWVKAIAFLFPFPLLLIIGLALILFGYQTCGKGLCKWTLLGWLFYFILLMFCEIFNALLVVKNLVKTHIENRLYMKCNYCIFVLSISLQTRLN